jgi:hypothetical protein
MMGLNDNHVIRVVKYNSIKDKQGKGFKLPVPCDVKENMFQTPDAFEDMF